MHRVIVGTWTTPPATLESHNASSPMILRQWADELEQLEGARGGLPQFDLDFIYFQSQ